MTDLRAAAQQALEALGKWSSGHDMDAVELNDLIATLEAALEQPEQEEYTLVAWFNGKPVYSAPPRCSNCASLEAQNTELDRKLAKLEAVNGELLEALRLIERLTREADGIAINVRDMLGGIARAAMARAEGKA
jgi:hypothetical protein